MRSTRRAAVMTGAASIVGLGIGAQRDPTWEGPAAALSLAGALMVLAIALPVTARALARHPLCATLVPVALAATLGTLLGTLAEPLIFAVRHGTEAWTRALPLVQMMALLALALALATTRVGTATSTHQRAPHARFWNALPALLLALPGAVALLLFFGGPDGGRRLTADLMATLPRASVSVGHWYLEDAGRPGLHHKLWMLAGVSFGSIPALVALHAAGWLGLGIVLHRAVLDRLGRAAAFGLTAVCMLDVDVFEGFWSLRSWASEIFVCATAAMLLATSSPRTRTHRWTLATLLFGLAASDDPLHLATLAGLTLGIVASALASARDGHAGYPSLRDIAPIAALAAVVSASAAVGLFSTLNVHAGLDHGEHTASPVFSSWAMLYLATIPFGVRRARWPLHGATLALVLAVAAYSATTDAHVGEDKLWMAQSALLLVALADRLHDLALRFAWWGRRRRPTSIRRLRALEHSLAAHALFLALVGVPFHRMAERGAQTFVERDEAWRALAQLARRYPADDVDAFAQPPDQKPFEAMRDEGVLEGGLLIGAGPRDESVASRARCARTSPFVAIVREAPFRAHVDVCDHCQRIDQGDPSVAPFAVWACGGSPRTR